VFFVVDNPKAKIGSFPKIGVQKMRFILKQLHLFFPFIFPLHVADGPCFKETANEEKILAQQKRIEDLEARVKELEKALEDEKKKTPKEIHYVGRRLG